MNGEDVSYVDHLRRDPLSVRFIEISQIAYNEYVAKICIVKSIEYCSPGEWGLHYLHPFVDYCLHDDFYGYDWLNDSWHCWKGYLVARDPVQIAVVSV